MLRLVLSVLLLGSSATVASAVAKPIPFSFGAAFGSNMVLQQAPAKAAVYGFTSSSAAAAATAVKVTVSSGGKDLYSVDASIDTTVHQPFGAADGYGPLPCTSCPPYKMSSFSLLGKPAPAWKALLKVRKIIYQYGFGLCLNAASAWSGSLSVPNTIFAIMLFFSSCFF